jgi:hypothetical protein
MRTIHVKRPLRVVFLLMAGLLWGHSAGAETQPTTAELWQDFTRQLEQAGLQVLANYPQPTPQDEAEGLRYLLQQLGSSIEYQLVREPGEIPLLRLGATTINKWGMDGADVKYQGAPIDPVGRYLFSGRLGSARLTAIQLNNLSGQTYQAFGSLTGDQFKAADTGEFQVLLATSKPKDWQGPWLALEPETTDLLVREYFGDWGQEQPGHYRLQRLDSNTAKPPLTLPAAEQLLGDTVSQFSQRVPQWQSMIEQTRQHLVNKVVMRKTAQGLGTNFYGSGWFRVAPDEALVIEIDAPEAALWSVQLGNIWWESLDYINRTGSYNGDQAVVSSDGKYRFVLSHSDPGVPNWLDPAGHLEGAILFRLQESEAPVQPKLQLVSRAELSRFLPEDTPDINNEQRRQEIALRRSHAATRWSP